MSRDSNVNPIATQNRTTPGPYTMMVATPERGEERRGEERW